MKRFQPFLPALPVCLLFLLLLWHSQTPPALETDTAAKVAVSAKPARALAKKAFPGPLTSASAAGQAFLPREASDLKLPRQTDLRWEEPVSEPIFEEFRRWTAALPAARAGADLQHGLELAQQRRHELLALIEKNPRRALELAVPDSVRQQLPEEIVALMEERVDAQGDLLVQSTTLDNDRGCMTTRAATLQDDKVFDVHSYGRRSAMPTRDNIAIHGVALDGKLALSEFPGRVLGPSEVAARVEAGQSVGKSQEQTDAADGPVIAFGDDLMIRYPDETQAVAALLLAEGEEQSGATAALASDLDGVIAYSPMTEGPKTLLIIRVDFPDFQGGSASDSTLQSLIADMNSVYKDMSNDKTSFALNGQGSAFTPVLRLPNNASYYNSFSRVLSAARTAATASGYNYTTYTYEVVVTGAQPVIPNTAGVAFVGARGAWLHNSQWNLKTCAHEVGHNFGLYHSGAWDTDDGSVIGPGEVWDYGNIFDIMGVGSSPHTSRHFGASVKNFLDWVPDADLVKITTNGTTTTRIRAMDKNQADGNKRALVVDRASSSDDYWIEHRQLYGTNFGMQNGVLVNWANIAGGQQQPLLLDMRPDTSEKTDAVLPLGMTFSDTAAGINITPVARGTDPDGVNWIDVTTTRGNVSGNLKPLASLSATNSNPALNAGVTFTCTASDPNGDTLAYFWDWGNGTTTANNSPTGSKSWPTAGVYIVKCTVSDMKGLTTSADYVVQVGATGTFFIEGLVRTVQGNPLAGVVVTASPTTLKATSDATGRYIITGLAAGTYTLTVSSGTPDGFTNPVTVGPSLQDRNFVLQSSSLIWDVSTSAAGAQDGGGNWANGAGNWLNQTTGENNQWNNTNLDSATFGAGTDGTYAVTLSGTVQAGGGITFNNSGYTLSGTALSLVNGSLDGAITVAAGKTATINSAITYADNAAASITVNSGAVLNLGGGASNSQYNFLGSGGTVNMTAGTYSANVGSMSVATFNKTGGTFNITPGNNNGYNVSSNSRNLNFTLSGGALSVNGNAVTPTVNNAYLGIGNGTAISNTSTMTVKSGATVNVGTTATTSGEIRISNTPESNGTLDVQGGTLTVGTGSTANKIYFFKAGTIDAPYLARMSQSGGTVTANGIQFGNASATYDAASSAALQLSGGSLYVGLQGIIRASAAVDLAVAIQLQGGIIGASDTWSSSLNMQLGTTGGGPVFQAASSGGVSKNITLSGVLSDDDGAGTLIKTGSGTLVLQGANTFTGGVTIKNGTLESKTTQTTLGTGTVTMGGAGSTGATFITGQNNSNPFVINAPISGSIVIGTNGSGSGFTMSGPVTLNGNLTIQTSTTAVGATSSSIISGGVTGTGNLLLNNVGVGANVISLTTNPVNHTGSITLQGTSTGNTTLSAGIGSNVTGITQNSATSLMILSGANTYACNLTINAGNVRISNNFNTANDASTVTIAATGATLNLTYTGTDKVNKLVIGSTLQADGVYGKVGSASPVIGISQITGDGTLTVGPVTPPGFSSWITGTFANGTVPGGQQGPNDDFDKDGISNLVEYAIAGQDPTVPNPTIGTFTAGGALGFSKRLDATGITYDIESSTLLTAGSWTTLPKPPVVESAGSISYSFTPGTPVKNFARLKVTQLP
jgi:autotransporter-associated beta strand protein